MLLLLFGGIWTFVTMGFNIILLTSVIGTYRAQHFAETTGTMIAAEVDRRRGSDSTTYAPALQYIYDIAGQTYTGTRYGVRDFATSSRRYAAEIVQDHQPGTEVVVYYDPDRPEKALLNREFSGPVLFLPIFLTPFNAVMLACWWLGLRTLWISSRRPIAGGYRVRYYPPLLNVRLGAISTVLSFLFGAGLTGFVLIFAILAPTGGEPSLEHILWAKVGVACGGGLGVVFAWLYNRSPKRWLTLDESTGEIILPTAMARMHVRTIDRDAIEAIELMPASELEERTGRRWASVRMGGPGGSHGKAVGGSQGKAAGYAVVLLRGPEEGGETERGREAPVSRTPAGQTSDSGQLIPVLISQYRLRAELLASWLGQQLGLTPRSTDPT